MARVCSAMPLWDVAGVGYMGEDGQRLGRGGSGGRGVGEQDLVGLFGGAERLLCHRQVPDVRMVQLVADRRTVLDPMLGPQPSSARHTMELRKVEQLPEGRLSLVYGIGR